MLDGIRGDFGGEEAEVVDEIVVFGGFGMFDSEPSSGINTDIAYDVGTPGKAHLADQSHFVRCHLHHLRAR
ncbi:hypothetical protein [Spongiactinospora rosea]|uniref:hypothetical protein n=1 Tax=Spongiactinospora rosea TaxID=2248750 RepID=UPI0018F52792|nr:hypothetical protein [Spongiactinospora rosea]